MKHMNERNPSLRIKVLIPCPKCGRDRWISPVPKQVYKAKRSQCFECAKIQLSETKRWVPSPFEDKYIIQARAEGKRMWELCERLGKGPVCIRRQFKRLGIGPMPKTDITPLAQAYISNTSLALKSLAFENGTSYERLRDMVLALGGKIRPRGQRRRK